MYACRYVCIRACVPMYVCVCAYMRVGKDVYVSKFMRCRQTVDPCRSSRAIIQIHRFVRRSATLAAPHQKRAPSFEKVYRGSAGAM